MVRKSFFLTNDQFRFLKRQKNLTVSEQIRRAIDEYIEKKKNQIVSVSLSGRRDNG